MKTYIRKIWIEGETLPQRNWWKVIHSTQYRFPSSVHAYMCIYTSAYTHRHKEVKQKHSNIVDKNYLKIKICVLVGKRRKSASILQKITSFNNILEKIYQYQKRLISHFPNMQKLFFTQDGKILLISASGP